VKERDLLAAVAAAPDDDAPKLVYADWLIERGDARGEHIRLAIAGRSDEAKALVEAHPEWSDGMSLWWSKGFAREAWLDVRPYDRELVDRHPLLARVRGAQGAIEAFPTDRLERVHVEGAIDAARLAALPFPRLGELELDGQYVTDLAALASAPWFPTLEKLWARGEGALDALVARASALRDLSLIDGPQVGLGALAAIPNLERLNLTIRYLAEEQIEQVLAAPRLRVLRLLSTRISDGLAERIAARGLWELHLPACRVSLAGARRLRAAGHEDVRPSYAIPEPSSSLTDAELEAEIDRVTAPWGDGELPEESWWTACPREGAYLEIVSALRTITGEELAEYTGWPEVCRLLWAEVADAHFPGRENPFTPLVEWLARRRAS
jgi:uncharacterized protein (TIGR02996 family)